MNETPGNNPKISIITAVYNGGATLRSCIESILAQTYPNIEYIIKDGGSSDETLAIVGEYVAKINAAGVGSAARAAASLTIKVISGRDGGIYDAMNEGLRQATGEIVALLNADDFYTTSRAVADMVALMERTKAQTGWGDIIYVDRRETRRIVRRWKSSPYAPGKFLRGWHPPHPAFFVRRELYECYGYFNTTLRVSADYELMLRFLEKHHASSCYLPETLVTMRRGGASGRLWTRLWRSRLEDLRAWRLNGLHGGLLAAFCKPFSKIWQ